MLCFSVSVYIKWDYSVTNTFNGLSVIKEMLCRVRATDRHCRKMRRNNKFGAKNFHLATTIGERKIASENFCLASECHLRLKSLPRAALC